MNPIRRVWEWLYPPAGPKLRNKAGGMAWIRRYGEEYGADAIAGHAVRTVRLDAASRWLIDPPQLYVVTAIRPDSFGNVCAPGNRLIVLALDDECLEPWKEDGVTDTEVADLYAPWQAERVPSPSRELAQGAL